ncbi:MAG: hypothetical protein ACO1SV_04030 [Fimbriimonas sp.]
MITSLAMMMVSLQVKPGPTGDQWATPVPRVFASTDGLFGFKVIPTPDAKGATGTLFALDPAGAERVVWTKPLVCLPVEVRVSGKGHVATIDVWGAKGKAHALVMYDRSGKVVADHDLGEVFPSVVPTKHPYFLVTRGSIHWTVTTEIGFDLPIPMTKDLKATESGSRLFLRGVWRESVVFDPDTGKVLLREKT